MSNDTASVPSEDLRDLGIDAPEMQTGLLIVWASEEWGRLGQVSLFTSTTNWFSVGRGPELNRPGFPGGSFC